jgi:hypothetical protein
MDAGPAVYKSGADIVETAKHDVTELIILSPDTLLY